ncbi:MAG: LysR substrate-binding domain-containing protein, partial [Comamonas sp.]
RRERMVLIMPRGHALARHAQLAYEEALDYAQVGLRDSSIVQETLDREARSGRRMLRQRIEVDSLSAMCRMIECGLGVGVMPEGAYQRLGETRELHAVPLTDAWAEREVLLVARDFETLPMTSRLLVEHLAAA